MDMKLWVNLAYIIAAIAFIFGLKMLSSARTARRGNLISALGMLLAIIVTLLQKDIISYEWIILGVVVGGIIGASSARLVAMTAMPQMVAVFNGFGGIASLLVGWSEYHNYLGIISWGALLPIYLAVIIGGITFTGSLVAYGKLSGRITGRPILFSGQRLVNALFLLLIIVAGVFYIGKLEPQYTYWIFFSALGLSLLIGVMAVIPIGGADMPVVIALLNSYSGLAACAAGFVILNNVLIVAGALVGASGIILTKIMCKAMNRSLANVLFSGFGAVKAKQDSSQQQGEAKPISIEDCYYILEAAQSVIIAPGYGMAVAQAQHVVRELGDLLTANGAEVRYAIHPVAGRMPGHMNVLLAEANVDYDQLSTPDDVNPTMDAVDVCVVIGANDVVNPAARDDENSPIYGMPIIDVDRARSVIVLKRSMAAGFAGIDNLLFFADNTRMLFGDAKSSVAGLVAEFKSVN